MTVAQIIKKIEKYISRCNIEKNYQGTHDEQISLRNIQENYLKLSSDEQKDVQDNYHLLYSQSFSSYQKNYLEKTNEYMMKIAAAGAVCGGVSGIVLGTGCFKTALAGGIFTYSGSFFSNRALEKSDDDIASAKKKILPFERIRAIFEYSQPSPEMALILPDLSKTGLRRRMPGS